MTTLLSCPIPIIAKMAELANCKSSLAKIAADHEGRKEGRKLAVGQFGPRSIEQSSVRLGIASKVRCFADEIKREERERENAVNQRSPIRSDHIRFRSDFVV